MEIKLDIHGVKELAAKLDPVTREAALIRGLNKSGEHIKGWIQRERLSGPRPVYLGVITNRLRSSIATSGTVRQGDSLINKIGTNVEYAPIHEFGGTIHRRAMSEIFIRNRYVRGSKAGSFKKGTTRGRGFTRGTSDTVIPERPFMRPSIEDPANQQEVLNLLTQELQRALNA